LELNVTDVNVAALAIVAVPRSTIAMTMAPAVNLFMRWMGLKPDESSCPTTE
jgi:ribosomal protein L34E